MIGAKARELYPTGILACDQERSFGEQLTHCQELDVQQRLCAIRHPGPC
jgi:hypothetical protein